MILNRSSYPCVYRNRVEYRNDSSLYRIAKFDDADYWYISIFYSEGIIELVKFEDIIPQETLDKVRNDERTCLLVSCDNEANIEHIERIYDELICKLAIPSDKIVVYSDNVDIGIEIDRVASLYNQPIIKYVWCSVFQMMISFQLRRHLKLISSIPTLEKKTYNKSFINFNRKWRIHRPMFVGLLHCYKMLDRGYISLGVAGDGMNWDSVFDYVSTIKDSHMRTLLLSNEDSISKIPNLYLDTTNLAVNRPKLVEDDIGLEPTARYYRDTYFSIVSETHFFDSPGRFLTEKTFKPIAFKHPILMISSPHSLELLKTMGYKTFHPYINESYDTIQDDESRMMAILIEANRLANLSHDEVMEFIDNVKPIVEHNYNVLLGK